MTVDLPWTSLQPPSKKCTIVSILHCQSGLSSIPEIKVATSRRLQRQQAKAELEALSVQPSGHPTAVSCVCE